MGTIITFEGFERSASDYTTAVIPRGWKLASGTEALVSGRGIIRSGGRQFYFDVATAAWGNKYISGSATQNSLGIYYTLHETHTRLTIGLALCNSTLLTTANGDESKTGNTISQLLSLGSTPECTFWVKVDGALEFTSGTYSFTIPNAFYVGYCYLEFEVYIHETAGYIKVFRNKTLINESTNIHTGSSAVDVVQLFAPPANTGTSQFTAIDDIYIAEGNSSAFTPLGPVYVYAYRVKTGLNNSEEPLIEWIPYSSSDNCYNLTGDYPTLAFNRGTSSPLTDILIMEKENPSSHPAERYSVIALNTEISAYCYMMEIAGGVLRSNSFYPVIQTPNQSGYNAAVTGVNVTDLPVYPVSHKSYFEIHTFDPCDNNMWTVNKINNLRLGYRSSNS